ncbi:MAG: SLC13 family permease, partial [Pseudomonas sagittaria]|nr:SLC13 family permease [Pseudomonas sagittaria]
MAGSQVAIVAVLLAALTLFLWGRWRHDLVAMAALLACVLLGLVPVEEAFAGFGHPAVITVACVLVLGHGLQSSGAVDILAQRLLPGGVGPTASLLALLVLAAVLSGFMNNVGALALLMPIALQMAAKHQLAPGRVLMPLSFASILGGMTTLIGTPPNLIVSGYREASGLGGFAMFDFAPVGLAVALFGVLFIALLGWRWVPTHGPAASGGFESEAYLSEVSITEGSKAANKTLHEVEQMLDEAEAQIVGLVRHDIRVVAPGPRRRLHAGDILIVEVEPESLAKVLSSLGLHLVEDVPAPPPESAASAGTAESAEAEPAGRPPLVDGQRVAEEGQAAAQQAPREAARSGAEEVVIQELVVMPGSSLIRRSATDVELRSRYGINLLAISRQGLRMIRRLRSTPVRAGDVLLMQGGNEALAGFAGQFGCLPLAPRDIRVPRQGQALLAGLVMALSVAVAASDLL